MIEDANARAVFDSMVQITVDRGDEVLFWCDRWLHGFRIADIAPLLLATVQTRVVNSRTVQQALTRETWKEDCNITASFTA